MAQPPFLVNSAEITACWQHLGKLLTEERELDMLDEIQRTVDQHGGLHDLLQLAAGEDENSELTIEHIKSNLDIQQDLGKDIDAATEAYNVAVCRVIGPMLYVTLPRELRDMIYEYLIVDQVVLHLEPVSNATISVRSDSGKRGPYIPTSPRPESDMLCQEYYWRDNAVSCEVAQELIEFWYRNSTFRIIPTGGWAQPLTQGLDFLLLNDRFHAGFQPQKLISKFTRELTIRCRKDLQDTHWRNNALASLDELSLLKKHAYINLIIFVDSSFWSSEQIIDGLRELLELFRSVLLRLRQEEYRLSVFAEPFWSFKEVNEMVKVWMQGLGNQ